MSGNDEACHPRFLLNAPRTAENDRFKGLDLNLVKISGDWNTLLHSATIWDNGFIARYLIDLGTDVDSLNFNSETPLMLAVEAGSAEVVKVLLEANADIDIADADGVTAPRMIFDSEYNDTEILELFLQRLRRDSSSNEELARRLVDVGCSMYHACFSRDLRLMGLLLDRGIDVNSRGYFNMTALHVAVDTNDANLANWLIDNGADLDSLDDEGKSPLFEASRRGKADMVRLLLERGADPNVKRTSDGWSPLYAIFVHSLDDVDHEKFNVCAEHLLRRGAIPANPSADGQTIFDYDLLNRAPSKRIYYVMCQLAILEDLGEIEAKTVMYYTVGDRRSIADQLETISALYATIKRLLAFRLYDGLTLFRLLTARDEEMRAHARNATIVAIVDEVLAPMLSEACSYYHGMLMRRVLKAVERVKLEDAAIARLFDGHYNLWYCFARRMVGYLNDDDLRRLSDV